ncbi:MAG: hypothetical protein U0992_13745 [Planctomycetaceae bacterium]
MCDGGPLASWPRQYRSAGEIDRPAGYVCTSTPPGKTIIPVASIVHGFDEPPAANDAQVFDLAIDAIGRVVNFSAGDSQHGFGSALPAENDLTQCRKGTETRRDVQNQAGLLSHNTKHLNTTSGASLRHCAFCAKRLFTD